MNVLSRTALGLCVSACLFSLWRGGVWIDSLNYISRCIRGHLLLYVHVWAYLPL